MPIIAYFVILFVGLVLAGLGLFIARKDSSKPGWPNLLIIGFIFVLTMFVVIVGNEYESNDHAIYILEEGYELNLYYDSINNSHNEYVRYDFYERVEKYNESYNRYMEKSENFFLAPFYKIEKLGGNQKISFPLRNEDYYSNSAQG